MDSILASLGESGFREFSYKVYRVRTTESNGTRGGNIACLVLYV